MKEQLTFGSLFTGIGGIDLGLELAGFEVRWQVEIDPFRRAVLEKHWPSVPKYNDIRELRGDELEKVDLVCGGPPCQPFSVAGKRKGKDDDRYLWPEMLRIIKAVRPRWVLFENVANIVNMALDTVLFDLEAEGYETGTLIIPACAVGAPHRRDRVWVLAYSPSVERQPMAKEQGVLRRVFTDREEHHNADGSGKAQSGEDVAHTSSERLQKPQQERQYARPTAKQGRRAAESSLGPLLDGLSSRMVGYKWPAPCGCEQYDWEPPRVTVGKITYRKQMLQAIGDAVVPQVVEALGWAIRKATTFIKKEG